MILPNYIRRIKTLGFKEIVLFFLTTLFFFLNINHLSEQGIYFKTYLPIANNLINNFSFSISDNITATYPMWGYPVLLAIFEIIYDASLIFIFQYILCIYSLFKFFEKSKKLSTYEQIVSYIIFLFYVMLLSVKWPGAIYSFLFFMFALSHLNKEYLRAGLFLSLAYNFRSEALIFLIVYIFFIILRKKHYKIIISLALLCPWILFQFYSHGKIIPTSTNSGGVLYISLGQLPNNKWERIHLDEEAQKYVINKSNGEIQNPWSLEANKILSSKFKEDVIQHPDEFFKKIIYNGISSFLGGLYVTETHHIFMDNDNSQELIKYYRSNKIELLKDFFKIRSGAVSIVSLIVLELLSILFLMYLIISNLFYLFKRKLSIDNIFMIFIGIQFIICMLIQYQPRHISNIIILFFFLLLTKNHYRWQKA